MSKYSDLQKKNNYHFFSHHDPTCVHHGASGACMGTLHQFAQQDKGKSWIRDGALGSFFRYGIEGGEATILEIVTPDQFTMLDYAGADKWYFNQITGLGLLKRAEERLASSDSLIDKALAQDIAEFLGNFTREMRLGE